MAGATVYSVEGAVWGAFVLGWASLRLTMAGSLLDQAVTIPVGIAGVVNLIACTLADDSEKVQTAHFNIVITLLLVYLELVVDSASSSALSDTLFGYMAFALVTAAISASLLTVQLLLSAAAIGSKLWSNLYWMDATVLLLTAFHAGLGRGAPNALGISSTILVLNLACFGTLGLCMWEISWDTIWKCGIRAIPFVQWLHVGVTCLTGVLSVALAYVAHTTTWALIILLCALLAGIVVRAIYRVRSGGQIQPDGQPQAAVSGALGFPGPPQPSTAPSAPPAAAVNAAAAAPATTLRFHMDPMQGYYPVQARLPVKSKGQ
jgi:hypothetical protein